MGSLAFLFAEKKKSASVFVWTHYLLEFVQQKTKTIGGRVKGAKMGSKRLNRVC
jgi:hypothetical protein